MDLNLKDKIALVTGGSSGLGKAICLGLAEEGAKVAVNYYRNTEKGIDFVDDADEVVQEIKDSYSVDATAAGCDVSIESDVVSMFDKVEKELGPIDILVNNAALCPTCLVHEMTEQMWSDTIQTNLTGTFFTSKQLVKRLLESEQEGKIVNIVSQAAFRGSTTGHAPYDASKGGIVSFTIALAREVAQKGINVNAVAPGMIRTEMVAKVLEANEEKYLNRIPLHRIATPKEVADVVVFLASERARYMTGATVDVTGGMLMR
ncbi:MAG: SDR family NAD(P)-dependent oxidoreductase [Planctomycetota bacterium]|jgi:3-oxoacyl-[acyl-carrier protein] reductase